MQSLFQIFIKLGFLHIADIKSNDHILFIIALCVIYRLSEWRNVLVLVTAFTIGHSITLALAAMHYIVPNVVWIEFLIPCTIFFTSIYNVLNKEKNNAYIRLNYVFALVFGLIHGLGFSNYLNSLLGQEENLMQALLSFNIGLEFGQLLIVSVVMMASYLALNIFKFSQRDWTLFVSGGTAALALTLTLERWP